MMRPFILTFLLLPALLHAQTFEKGDRILLYGASDVNRMQEQGHWEAALQVTHADKNLRVRSLAWCGDEAGHRLRPEGYPNHLKKLLAEWPADHVLLFVGRNEHLQGEAGLARFEADLRAYVEEMKVRHEGARMQLVPPSSLTGANDKPDELKRYDQVVDAIGHETGIEVESHERFGGVSTRRLAAILKRREVARAVVQKHAYAATLVRPVNAVIYYGVRARKYEYDTEMPRYHDLLRQSDDVIHKLAAAPTATFASQPKPSLPPLPAGAKKGTKKGVGKIFPPAEQEKTLNVADGYALNLFASEQEFPDLRNPVQINFDHLGRLWVVTMPNWPHTIPGEAPSDKILILEDKDRDGKADTCTTFADGLNVPDGVVLYRDGAIVSAQPRLLFMRDTDGDSVADETEELLRGIDVTDAHHGGMIQLSPIGDVMFCDGVFHRSQLETPQGVVRGVGATTYRFNLSTRSIHPEYQTLTPNPWKMAYDRWGNLHHMYGDGYVQDSHAIPWTPFGVYHPFGRSCYIKYGKGSAANPVSSPNFPEAYQDGMISATLLGRYFVAMSKTSAASGIFKASDRLDLVSSKNAAFRPVDTEFGMDGALYVSDFCSPIIGHAQHPMRDPQWDHDHGRIWRVAHTARPVVTNWPHLDAADPEGLLAALAHPQDLVRLHARNQLRLVPDRLARLGLHIKSLSVNQAAERQALLECLRLFVEAGKTNPALFDRLLTCDDPMTRAGALHLLRFQVDQLDSASAWLKRAATDPHPRVRVQLVHLLSHLQIADASWMDLIGAIKADDAPALRQVIQDASYGSTAARGPEVPVLRRPAEARIEQWLLTTTNGTLHYVESDPKRPKKKDARLSTWVTCDTAQTATLSVKTGYVTIRVNGLPVLEAATFWSSDWNVQIELKKGINQIEAVFPNVRRARGPAPVYVYDRLGRALEATAMQPARSEAELRARQAAWSKQEGIDGNTIRIVTLPAQMQFTPNTFTVKAGHEIRLLFTNQDAALHNLVITRPGRAEAVGAMSDLMLQNPAGIKDGWVPKTDDVLWATRMLEFRASETLTIQVPKQTGTYPFICTFPGHRHVMKGEMIVVP